MSDSQRTKAQNKAIGVLASSPSTLRLLGITTINMLQRIKEGAEEHKLKADSKFRFEQQERDYLNGHMDSYAIEAEEIRHCEELDIITIMFN